MNQDDWLRKRTRGQKRPGCGAEIGALVGLALLGWFVSTWL
ncbi:MAG: hypothetical protein V4850_02740 [Myxococcota bacterium]